MSEDVRARLEALGRTSAELLHDLAADLQVLRGWARLVADGVRTGRAAPPDAEALEEEAERVGRLISDVVGWLADPHPRGSFLPAQRLRAVVERVDRREGVVPLEVRIRGAEALRMSGPPTFFDRIAANLIRNAVRHAERGVRITLSAETRSGAEGVLLCVEDDGAGVDASVRGRLFTPFARGHGQEGHGLGLSSTAWLSQQLAGVPPEVGSSTLGGAAMEAWFPARSARPAVEAPLRSLAGLRVLLVEDDEAVRRVLLALLHREGASAEGIDLGPELAERVVAAQPDLLLLDRHLGGFSGLDLWRSVRVRDPALAHRTALLTGGAEAGDRSAEPPVLRKPLDLDALRRFAARALGADVAAAPASREAAPVDARPAPRGCADAFREVLRALDAGELDLATARLQHWTAGVDGAVVPPTVLAELGEAAWLAREALGRGEVGAAREWVERGLARLAGSVDAA